jgi:hypothetical protein
MQTISEQTIARAFDTLFAGASREVIHTRAMSFLDKYLANRFGKHSTTLASKTLPAQPEGNQMLTLQSFAGELTAAEIKHLQTVSEHVNEFLGNAEWFCGRGWSLTRYVRGKLGDEFGTPLKGVDTTIYRMAGLSDDVGPALERLESLLSTKVPTLKHGLGLIGGECSEA